MSNEAEFLNTYKKIEDAFSKTIKINREQVLQLVVDDLIEKYKFNKERGNQEWTAAFEEVLSYYLDENEMKTK